jgi:hypothetical protein
MEELNKASADDLNKVSLNLLIDNRTDILINKELLVRILSHLENKGTEEIYDDIEDMRMQTRQRIVNALARAMSK